MKTTTKKIMAELLTDSIDEGIDRGDIVMTWRMNEKPVLLVGNMNSAIRYVYGIKDTNEFGVLSLN